MLALFMTGFWFATVYKRWRATGMLVAWTGIALLVLGLLALTYLAGLVAAGRSLVCDPDAPERQRLDGTVLRGPESLART